MSDRTRSTVLFVVITYAVSIAVGVGFKLLGGKLGTPVALLVFAGYMWIPGLTALGVTRLSGLPLKRTLGLGIDPKPVWLIFWLSPVFVTLAVLGVELLLPGVHYAGAVAGLMHRLAELLPPEKLAEAKAKLEKLPIPYFWLALMQGLIAGPTINLLAALGEELGWRGLLQRNLAHLGFWSSSLAVGAIWGAWHAPIILQGYNYPQHPVIGAFMMVVMCMLLAPLFAWARVRGRSVFAPSVMHGTVNAVAGLASLMVVGGSDLTVGVLGLAAIPVLLLCNLGIFFFDRKLPETTREVFGVPTAAAASVPAPESAAG